MRRMTGFAAVCVLGLPWVAAGAAPEKCVVRFDFETGDLQGWRVVEGKFDFLVCDKKTFRNRPQEQYNKQGTYFLTSLELTNGSGNDGMTGVVESPVFVLDGPEMSFLVGGGQHPETYVALCTPDGKEAAQARGRQTETMFRVTWKMPELVGKPVFLRLHDNRQGGWGHITFDDFTAAGRIDPEATEKRFATRKPMLKAPGRKAKAARRAAAPKELPSPGSPETLRKAIADLSAAFGDRYPQAAAYLARLAKIEPRLQAQTAEITEKAQAEFLALQREALIANPLVGGQPILFVVREQYRSDHHNTATMFQTGEINTGSFRGRGGIKAIDLKTGEVLTLLETPTGLARDPEVSFDGRRVLLSMRKDIQDDYHLYELEAASRQVRQLTFGAGVSDFDPLYLPDGRIAFSSTREPKFCMCNRHIMGNLFRMDADGANLEQIGKSTLHEGHGALMPDGRVLYDRWEYIDRNFGDAQGLWTCNPDGTNHAVWYGNNTPSPGAVLDARVIPGTGGDRFVATYSSCHDRPWGALAVVDRSRGIDTPVNPKDPTAGPEVRMWPESAWDLLGRGNYDKFKATWPKYEDPFPLHDPAAPDAAGKYFLCSRMTGSGEQMGVCLLDVFGNEVLLHAEPTAGCFDPMPLAAHPRPAAVPDRSDLAEADGRFYVHDVYVGTGMERVRRGAVKHLRVVESPEKRFWTKTNWQGSGTQAPGMAWDDFNNKRILGTVDVEPDGSCYFSVPADRFVYFQLLDANGMMVQSMRSGTITRPGETTGCVGCHESRHTAVRNRAALSLRKGPQALRPWYGPARDFNYVAEVQPVFDRNCMKCHDHPSAGAGQAGKPGWKKVILAGDLGIIFNASYLDLRAKRLVNVPGAGPAHTMMPYSWGSHASRLVEVLRKGHNEVRLSPEDFDRLVTWVDINAPYYAVYASAYPDNRYGRSPLDDRQLGRLGVLTGAKLSDQKSATQVSFTRPEISPCLAKLPKDGPEYAEALAIIQSGREMLAQRPRAEMPGFELIGVEAQRQAKYEASSSLLAQMRQAILAGKKAYPPGAAQPPQDRPSGG